uniref:Amino acid transporter transmembrane domain-containing protein n=2 Tax=Lotharella globosa TaxID=91324 RepID=A0A7S3YNK8_9EUKA
MGIVSVAYTTHAVFPTVVAEMKDVKEFPKALEISFGVVTLFYLLAGAGFYIYGKATDPQITFNLPERMQYVVSYAIIITICLKFALMINPVVLFVEKTCRNNGRLVSLLCIDPKSPEGTPIKPVRIVLVASCVLAALLIPYIALIHSVVGVFWSTFVCVVLPCVLALQLRNWLPIQYAAIWGLLGLSTVMMFTGLYQNILQIKSCYDGTNAYENMCN